MKPQAVECPLAGGLPVQLSELRIRHLEFCIGRFIGQGLLDEPFVLQFSQRRLLRGDAVVEGTNPDGRYAGIEEGPFEVPLKPDAEVVSRLGLEVRGKGEQQKQTELLKQVVITPEKS